jgi:hypothetical protein
MIPACESYMLPSPFGGPGEGIMDQNDREYYRDRMAAEENAAERASSPAAAQSHKQLAQEYAKLIERDQPVSAN